MGVFLRKNGVFACVALALFAAIVFGVGLGGVSGSSIHEWDGIVPGKTDSYRGWIVGKSRYVRGDEFKVSLPFVLAQCRSKEFFPRVNRLVNGGTDMFIQTPCAPVWDWTVFGQFHNWGYFLFGADCGLAWSWWSRYMLLPLFAFLFFVKWCDGDKMVAAAGSAAVTLGAPTQWWDTTVPYHLVYFFATLVFESALVSARSRVGTVLAGFGLFVSATSYFFVNYMPFTLMLMPALVLLSVYVWSSAGFSGKKGFRYAVLAVVMAGIAAELCYFFAVHRETLELVADSSYPGNVIRRGGSFNTLCQRIVFDWLSLCSAYVGKAYPNANQCGMSEFIGLWIPVAFVSIASIFRRRVCWHSVCLVVFATILLLWVSMVWPAPIARWTGMSKILPSRASVISGFVVIVVALRQVATAAAGRDGVGRRLAWIALAAFLLVRFVAFAEVPDALKWMTCDGGMAVFLEVACILSLCVVWGLLTESRRLFATALAAFSVVTGIFVHPLSSGTSPIDDKELSKKILEIDERKPGRWIANEWVLSMLPMALGLDSCSGTQMYCDEPFWKCVDPDAKSRSTWNRYAHRKIVDLVGRAETRNQRQLDMVYFSLDEDKTKALGIRYVIWRGKPLKLPWLKQIARIRNDGIYEVIDDGHQAAKEVEP